MHSLAQVTQVEAEYRETVELSLLDQPLESRGHLSYQAPDRLSKTSDRGDALLIDGDRVELVQGDTKTQLMISDSAVLESLVLALRSTFAGDLTRLRSLYRLHYRTQGDSWTLELQPIERGITNIFQNMRITGVENRIEQLDILEGNGDQRRMRLTDQRLRLCPGPGNGCLGTP